MAESSVIISYMQRRTSLSVETFLTSASVTELEISQSLASLANHIISTYSDKFPAFQRKNYRSLIRKITILVQLFEYVAGSGNNELTHTAVTCFKELYILLNRARDLFNYCLESSRLRLLLSNSMMPNYFHDLDREILCALDVIHSSDMKLSEDVFELLELLKKQLAKAELFVDPVEESLKTKILGFYNELQGGNAPDDANLRKYFVEDLGLTNKITFRNEIKCLEELVITSHEARMDIPPLVLKAFVALMQYVMLITFGIQEVAATKDDMPSVRRNEANRALVKTFIRMPQEFLCPISYDLMMNPVTLVTGQTFDRESIITWFQRGNFRCPVTRRKLRSRALIPNKAMRSLISMWSAAQGTPYNSPPRSQEEKGRNMTEESSTTAILEVNRATAKLLVEILSKGSESAKRNAISELQLMTKSDKQICFEIVKCGCVPLLLTLLKSQNQDVQKDASLSMLHLSENLKNRIPILEVKGCIKPILEVVKSGHTDQAKEYATSILCSLSTIQENKKKLAKERELLTILLSLLKEGSPVRRKNAMNTLKNLSTLEENWTHIIKAGSAKVLVEVLNIEALRKQAANLLAEMVKKSQGAREIRKQVGAVSRLADMLEWGDTSERKSAATTLLMFFLHGGTRAMTKTIQNPEMRQLIPSLLQRDEPEARSRAALLVRLHEQLDRVLSQTDC